MNEENNWDYIREDNEVKGAVYCVGSDAVAQEKLLDIHMYWSYLVLEEKC